jgi:hypothetical protein
MPTATGIEPEIEPGVTAELRRYNAEAAFRTACDIVRASFPAMRAFRVELLDDPDEDDRRWVLLCVFLPPSYPWETLHQEELRFHEAMVTRVPLELNLLFGLHMDHLPE